MITFVSHRLGTLIGISFAVDFFGAMLGPPIVGALFDASGNYVGASVFVCACLLGSSLLLCLVPPKDVHRKNLTVLVRSLSISQIEEKTNV